MMVKTAIIMSMMLLATESSQELKYRIIVADTIHSCAYLRRTSNDSTDHRVSRAIGDIEDIAISLIHDKTKIVGIAEISTYVLNHYPLSQEHHDIFLKFKRRLVVLS